MKTCLDSCTFYIYTGFMEEQDKKQHKYEELINYIESGIADGALKPGDKMYSENQMTEMFGVSRQTVRKAIGILEDEGIVHRVRGSGTYISSEHRENQEQCNRIAVITTYVDSYIFPKTIQGIERKLFERGYTVQIAFTNNTLEREKTIVEDLLDKGDVAGIIVEGTKSGLPNPNLCLYRRLIRRGIPILFINSYYPELEVPHVSLDDVGAARRAVEYLIERGHRDIGAVLKLDDGQGRLRYLGYLQAMEAAGLTVTDSRMVWIDTDESKQLAFCADRLLPRLEGCTAALCYNDQVAFQLIQLLQERGIRVPEQLSVISIDDSDLARHSEVPITSLPHPKEKLGEKAAESLLSLMAGKRDVTCEFDTRIVERSSVMDRQDGIRNTS